MKIKRIIFYTICLFSINQIVAQSNNLTNSPYSLYGLGVSNGLNTGKANTLGGTGIAMPSIDFINNSNPASYGSIPSNSFFYEIGVKAEMNELNDNSDSESRINGNFSNLSLAFPISKNSGAGITLLPYTTVGYAIFGVETSIEGSNETFFSNIIGSGGLNDLKFNFGYSLTDRFRLGVFGSYLFGNIEEEEVDNIKNVIFITSESNYYKGFRFGAGLQYDLSNKISLGATVNSPTQLNGSQNKTVSIQDSGPIINDDLDLNSFNLPLEIGFGLHAKLSKKLFINIDYKRNFWDATKQTDYIGEYVDQDIFGIGAEYTPFKNSVKYWKRIQYRTGFNYDNGYLSIDGNKINNYSLTIGAGLPIGRFTNSMFNVGYSYGQKGLISDGLIKENYHILSLNVSLEGRWFLKRKLN